MKFLNSLLNLIYPDVCEVCGRSLVSGEEVMCLHCLADMPVTNAHRDEFNIIHKRLASTMPIERAAGYFYYFRSDPYTHLIHRAKYSGRPKLARQLARRFSHQLMGEGFFDGIDCVVPVPMHWVKHIRRGYNQSEYICRGINDVAGVPLDNILEAARPHRTQTALGGLGRSQNLHDVYRVRRCASDLTGKHLLLVDDVVTTGATLLACRKAIYDVCPDAVVSVLVLGVTRLS